MDRFLQLNEHLTHAFSNHVKSSFTNRDQFLLETQFEILYMLENLVKESNAQLLFDLYFEIYGILAADQIDMEHFFRFHHHVSKAMRKNFKIDTLIQVCMKLSEAMIDGTQEVIRQKLIAAQRLLFEGMIDCTGNKEVKSLFKINEALSKTIAEKSEDKKLDLLAVLNLLVAQFMAADHQDTDTEWLMELNLLSALAMSTKVKKPSFLHKSIYVISKEMRKLSFQSPETVLKRSMELILTLSSLLLEANQESSSFSQLVTWKFQLFKVMQELLVEPSEEGMLEIRHNCLKLKYAAKKEIITKLVDEIDALTKARDAIEDELRQLNARQGENSQVMLKNKEKTGKLKVGWVEANSEAAGLEEQNAFEVGSNSYPSTKHTDVAESGSSSACSGAATLCFEVRLPSRTRRFQLYQNPGYMKEVDLPPVTPQVGNGETIHRGSELNFPPTDFMNRLQVKVIQTLSTEESDIDD